MRFSWCNRFMINRMSLSKVFTVMKFPLTDPLLSYQSGAYQIGFRVTWCETWSPESDRCGRPRPSASPSSYYRIAIRKWWNFQCTSKRDWTFCETQRWDNCNVFLNPEMEMKFAYLSTVVSLGCMIPHPHWSGEWVHTTYGTSFSEVLRVKKYPVYK